MTVELSARVRAELRAAANPERAPGMQAYMKSTMPFLGIGLTATRKLTVAVARELPPTDLDDLVGSVTTLWREAEFREERYAAQALLTLKLAKARLELLDLHREIIVTGDWWDHTDETMHRIGELLTAHPVTMNKVLRQWSRDENRWLRRSSVIAQLDAKTATDPTLLTAVIEATIDDPDFFLRKAIGWALRQYARTDPDWVRQFVATHPRLSALSVREATKHL